MATDEVEGAVHLKLPAMAPHPPVMPKVKLRLDPQRALEPARKKLSTVEAQRIMASLLEAIRRTELVTALPSILSNLDRYRVVIGQELSLSLEQHAVINESFVALRGSAEKILQKHQAGLAEEQDAESTTFEDIDNEPEKRSPSLRKRSEETDVGNQIDLIVRNLSLVAKQMQFSCRNILRMFTADPSALVAVLKEQNDNRTPEAKYLHMVLTELKDILMGMLLTTPGEESERNLYLKEISQRERYNASIIEKLEGELHAAIEDKDTEIKKKNDLIRHLKAELDQIEKFSNEHTRRTKADAEKQEAADLKINEGKRQKLHQDISTMKTQHQTLITEHRESELHLRAKKYKIETQVENWIQKYDTDMGERQAEFEEIDTVYTEEKKQLNELEERFKTLQTEYDQIVEERRIARERREAMERELLMSIKAATIIQAFWRSYKVRKALKSKKKKGKKGKKGKGK